MITSSLPVWNVFCFIKGIILKREDLNGLKSFYVISDGGWCWSSEYRVLFLFSAERSGITHLRHKAGEMRTTPRGIWSMDLGQWMQVSAASDCAWMIRHYYKRIIFCGFIAFLASFIWVQFNPDTYVSRAQVRFIPPQVAEKYVTSNVAMQIDQRIFALTQLVNSRLTATKMIENFGLYSERRVFSTIADLVPRFQQNLQMRGVGGTTSDGAARTVPSIQISFQFSDPVKSQKVVQRVVELIYEENRRYRGEQSMGRGLTCRSGCPSDRLHISWTTTP